MNNQVSYHSENTGRAIFHRMYGWALRNMERRFVKI